MAVAGDFNEWSPTPNLQLVADNTWQGDLFLHTSTSTAFRFVAEANWSLSWGESNQTSFTVPMTNTGEFAADYGKEMVVSNTIVGTYRFTFNDADGIYSVSLVSTGLANYASMAVAGDFNGWSTSPNMTVTTNNVWQTDLYLPAAAWYRFVLVSEENWSLRWGDTNQTDFVVPLTNTAELNPPVGQDAVMSNVVGGIYCFTFNDSNAVYTVSFVTSAVASNISMAVAGSFNAWNPLHNMTLVSNYTWEAAFVLTNGDPVTFKFTANDTWGKTWGLSNQTVFDVPLTGTADVVQGAGHDITLNNPADARHVFRFNDRTRYFEVVPDAIVEDFDDWGVEPTYGIYSNAAGWLVYSGLVNSTYSRSGLCTRLRDTPSTGQYVRTPFLSKGAGRLSFWHRHWRADATPALTYQVQSSPDGTTWQSNDTFFVTSSNYTRYVRDYHTTSSLYIRLYHAAGQERALFDDFVITSPEADVSIGNVMLTPSAPSFRDAVSVSASATPNALASNILGTLNYRPGESASFESIGMTGIIQQLTTTSSIPAQAGGSRVYYYIAASFDGPGQRSPAYWPVGGPTNPAFYGVSKTPPHSVWINEVNYITYYPWITTNPREFVELCGLARSDIGDWVVELCDTTQAYAAYHIPNNTMLPNDTNGFGFWVLADSGVTNANMVFTNIYENESSLAKPGAVRLRNDEGEVVYTLTYGDPAPTGYPGATYIGTDPGADYDISLSLAGAGGWCTNFVWGTNDGVSAGTANQGQDLSGGDTNPLPTLADVGIGSCAIFGSRITLTASGTNGWNPALFSSSAVTNDPSAWSIVANCDSSYSGGASTVSFDLPAPATSLFIRVKTSPTW